MELKPGYKRTEVGVIPEDWEVVDYVSFGQVIDGDRGIHYPSAGELRDSGHCLFLNAGNVTRKGFQFVDCQFISAEKDQKLGKGRLSRGDIVLTTRGTIGNFAHFTDEVPFEHIRINSGMVILRNASQTVDNSYQYLVLRSHIVESQLERLSFGSAQPQLTVKGISTLKIPLPPNKAEQHAIATALGDVDALLDALDKLIAKKRDLKQAAMQQLLTGQTRLPGFTGQWEVKRLGDVVKITKGQLITEREVIAGAVPVIAGGKKPAYFHNKPNRTGKTITVSASGASAGYVAFFDAPIFASDCSTISEGNDYSIEFVYYQLHLKQEKIYRAQTGGAQPHIHADDLTPLELGIPPLDEQTAIAAVLSEMDAEITALEARRDKTRALKQGMMQELLTGRTRLV